MTSFNANEVTANGNARNHLNFKRYTITCGIPRFSRQNETLLALRPTSMSQFQSSLRNHDGDAEDNVD